MRHLLFLSLLLSTPAFSSDITKVDLNKTRPLITKSLVNVNQNRILLLTSNVTPESVNPLVSEIKNLAKNPKEPIYLVIDSNGGSLDAGQKLIDTMRGAKSAHGLKTICIVIDDAFSMAAVISAYCHQTFMMPNSALMFHEAAYGIQAPASIIESYVKFNKKFLGGFEKRLAKQLGITYEKYVELRRDELWLTADEAVEQGFADGLIENFYYEVEPKDDTLFRIFFNGFVRDLIIKEVE